MQEPPQPVDSLETQRRQQLLQATMDCIAEVGVEKMTMWMVAERAGVSTGMLLYYFRTKRDLIASAVKQASKEFGERLLSTTHGEWGLSRLRESVDVILKGWDTVPRNFLIQYRMAALHDPEIRKSSLSQVLSSREALARSVRAAQADGSMDRELDETLVADLIYALANGLAAEVAAHPEAVSPERATQVAHLALDHLTTTAPGRLGQPTSEPRAQAETAEAGQGLTDPVDLVEMLLTSDRRLSSRTADQLAGAFRQLYEIALRENLHSRD